MPGPLAAPRHVGSWADLTASEQFGLLAKLGEAFAAGAQGFQVCIDHGHFHLKPAQAEVARLVTGASDPLLEALLAHPQTRALTPDWIAAYAARRRATPLTDMAQRIVSDEPHQPPPLPHPVQAKALEALTATRAAGKRAGLVVLATGLGKTWLAAFDILSNALRCGFRAFLIRLNPYPTVFARSFGPFIDLLLTRRGERKKPHHMAGRKALI